MKGGWHCAAALSLAVMTVAGCANVAPKAESLPADILFAKANPATVLVQGDTVFYTGDLSEKSSIAFDAAVAGIAAGQITRMVISSGGGDTVAGRHVGRWVQAMGVAVEVDVMCFSSCADYVFPAGRARAIRSDAFVGWHGNERQFAVLAARNGTSLKQEVAKLLPKDLPSEQAADLTQAVVDKLHATQQDEARFYAQLRLKDAFAVCAVGDILPGRSNNPDLKGWGFSIADMARLGLTSTYLGDGRYEVDSKRFRKYLWLMTADDCLALLK